MSTSAPQQPSTRLARLFGRTVGQRRWTFGLLIAGVVAVPLVVAGFFAGALNDANTRTDTVPAIVVNNDKLVTTTADGKTQQILAGRELVTQLTKKSSTGFQWSISNSADAKKALGEGTAYAVLTIPSDFSKSITSISGAAPKQADLSIKTDDAHSYLAGSVAQSVGGAMSTAFGQQITQQYLSGLYKGIAGVGSSLSKAADGATSLSSGAGSLATGLDSLSSGASSAATGAGQLSSGVDAYTNGVDQLSGGAQSLAQGTSGLSQLSSGVSQYTQGVSSASQGLDQLIQAMQNDPSVAPYLPSLKQVQSGLDQLSSSGGTLSSQTASAVSGVQSGASQLADAASQLSDGSSGLRSGASGLVTGLQQLASGSASSASGAHQLQSGASSLASGLSDGAKQVPSMSDAQAATAAKVVSNPVSVSVARENPISSSGPAIGMVLLPIGLWIGAIVIFLLLRPVTSLGLASTATSGRILMRGLARAGGLALAQAVLLTALLHLSLGVAWDLLPATLAFAFLLALVFTAVHALLTIAFKRAGVVISIVLLALQLTSVGGIVPIQLVSAPFQAISPFLPLSYAVSGMQGIVSGVGGGAVAGPAIALLLFGAFSVLVSLWVIARRRGARSFGFALAREAL